MRVKMDEEVVSLAKDNNKHNAVIIIRAVKKKWELYETIVIISHGYRSSANSLSLSLSLFVSFFFTLALSFFLALSLCLLF